MLGKIFVPLLLIISLLTSCSGTTQDQQRGPLSVVSLKDTCDDPDASLACLFRDMPAGISDTLRIHPLKSGSASLILIGRLLVNGTPAEGAKMYVYHTAASGLYEKGGKEKGVQLWHGAHHGWLQTDNKGHYFIETVRPGPYPDFSMPAHIHAAICLPSGEMFYINDFVFHDDSLAHSKYFQSLKNEFNPPSIDNGSIVLEKTESGYRGFRDILIRVK